MFPSIRSRDAFRPIARERKYLTEKQHHLRACEIMFSLPCVKKAKCNQQRVYNERRKEKPRKPQFSLNPQFGFGEKEEMRATNERFAGLLRSGRTNADFLIILMDRYEGKSCPDDKEMHLVEVKANATESVFELYAQREAEKTDCQWPCGEAPPCKQILSPASEEKNLGVKGEQPR